MIVKISLFSKNPQRERLQIFYLSFSIQQESDYIIFQSIIAIPANKSTNNNKLQQQKSNELSMKRNEVWKISQPLKVILPEKRNKRDRSVKETNALCREQHLFASNPQNRITFVQK